MESPKKWEKIVDSDDEVPLFPEGWAPKAKRVDSNDEALFSDGWGRWAPKAKRVDSDDEVSLFPKDWVPKEKRDPDKDVPLFSEGCKRKAKRMRLEKRRKAQSKPAQITAPHPQGRRP